MSEYFKKLESIEQEIKELVKKKNRLKKKEYNEEITAEEQIELEGLEELLTELKSDKKFWQGEVSKENTPELISKSFGEADADWIAE
ncbi:hypothetical protein HDV06_003811, partial [Boothiomyces sp. JEL0866]